MSDCQTTCACAVYVLCRAMYLTQGLKQGCNLSPLFFNLLMIDMAREIGNSNEDCKLGGKVFSGALFADDIGVVATSMDGLERLLRIVEREGAKFNMRISEKKSKIMVLKHGQNFVINAMPMKLDQVLHYKYLGVHLEARPQAHYHKEYETNLLKKAQTYCNVIRTKSRSFPDPAYAAFQLWHRTALPSILYGMQVMDVSVRTKEYLDSLHCKIGKFIFNESPTTQNVAAYLACQMEPIRFIVARMTNEAANRLCNPKSPLISVTLAVAEGQGHRNHFYRKYAEIHDSISNGQTFEQYQIASMIDFLSGELTRTRKTSFLFEPLGSFELDKEPYLSLTTEEYSDFIAYVLCVIKDFEIERQVPSLFKMEIVWHVRQRAIRSNLMSHIFY